MSAGEPADPAGLTARRPTTPPPCCAGSAWYPAIVFDTSAAASILADLCLRHPHVLQDAIFHEPVFPSGIPNADAVRAARTARVEEVMARGGRALRWSCTCAAWRAIRSTRRSIRSCANGCSATLRSCSVSRWLRSSLRSRTRPARSDTSAPRGHSGRRQPRQRGSRPLEVRGRAMARRPPPDHCHRPARGAHRLPRPARALRHCTAADTGQARFGRSHAGLPAQNWWSGQGRTADVPLFR